MSEEIFFNYIVTIILFLSLLSIFLTICICVTTKNYEYNKLRNYFKGHLKDGISCSGSDEWKYELPEPEIVWVVKSLQTDYVKEINGKLKETIV